MSARRLPCRIGLVLPCALVCAVASAASAGAATAAAADTASPAAPRIELVTLPSPQSPIVAIRAFFRTGSIDDPAGKEGLANLTASVVGEGATAKRPYKDLVEALYPLAASIVTRVDREVTVFSLVVHREKLDEATALLAEVLTQPGFDANDLERHRKDALSYLTTTLRASNDELLGLEALQEQIFAGHPYGHAEAGTVKGLGAVTLDDVKRFYREHYRPATCGSASPAATRTVIRSGWLRPSVRLPAGKATVRELPPAPQPERPRDRARRQGRRLDRHPLRLPAADHPRRRRLLPADGRQQLPRRAPHLQRPPAERAARQARAQLRQLQLRRALRVAALHHQPDPQRAAPSAVLLGVDPPGAAGERAVRAARRAARGAAARRQGDDARRTSSSPATTWSSYSKLWAQTLSRRLGFLLDSKFYGTPVLHRRDRQAPGDDDRRRRQPRGEEVPADGEVGGRAWWPATPRR